LTGGAGDRKERENGDPISAARSGGTATQARSSSVSSSVVRASESFHIQCVFLNTVVVQFFLDVLVTFHGVAQFW
jgi:hypothetical protein